MTSIQHDHPAMHPPPHPPTPHGRPTQGALRNLKPVHGGTLQEQLGFSLRVDGSSARGAARVWQRLGHTLRAVEGALRPTGCTANDGTRAERVINIATSLPFLAAGAHIMRQQRTSEGRAYGRSIVVVGCVATAYHASAGAARTWLRKADYWCISWATTCLLRALHPQSRAVKHATRLVRPAVPFQPFTISAANIAAAEVEFARMATHDADAARGFARHAACLAGGMACFALEDVALEHGCNVVHAAWHLLACAALWQTGGLLALRDRAIPEMPARVGGKVALFA